MLTGSTNLNDHLFKMKYSDTPNCECEEARETIDHYLMDCSIYNESRDAMMQQIGGKWMNNLRSGCLNINPEVLLAPNSTKLISREIDNEIRKPCLDIYVPQEKVCDFKDPIVYNLPPLLNV